MPGVEWQFNGRKPSRPRRVFFWHLLSPRVRTHTAITVTYPRLPTTVRSFPTRPCRLQAATRETVVWCVWSGDGENAVFTPPPWLLALATTIKSLTTAHGSHNHGTHFITLYHNKYTVQYYIHTFVCRLGPCVLFCYEC